MRTLSAPGPATGSPSPEITATLCPAEKRTLYYIAQRQYEDISAAMREFINCDKWLREKFADQFKWAESLKDTA